METFDNLPKREKINPLWAVMSKHPTWSDAEECRANWTKSKWKRAKPKGKCTWKENK